MRPPPYGAERTVSTLRVQECARHLLAIGVQFAALEELLDGRAQGRVKHKGIGARVRVDASGYASQGSRSGSRMALLRTEVRTWHLEEWQLEVSAGS